ncbi:MAG: hypothetical protein KJ822_10600 [Proteobacteria bacterium]|nr:hypothetical protein [Pseudomonadota bacterium]
MKVFIGGSRKLFRINNDIKIKIDKLIASNFTILIGDANGIDKSIQKYLYNNNYNNVLVYCVDNQCRNNIGKWEIRYIKSNLSKKDYKYYTLKDIEMAKESDYGIMIWDGESKGTLNNIINIIRQEKKAVVYLSPKKVFYNINNYIELNSCFPKCHELSFGMIPTLFSEHQ